MTERRRPAAASRILVAGGSVAATFALVGAMAGSATPSASSGTAAAQPIRVVITDPRIDPATAVAAAQRAAAAGTTTIRVPVGRVATGSGGSGAAHTATASS